VLPLKFSEFRQRLPATPEAPCCCASLFHAEKNALAGAAIVNGFRDLRDFASPPYFLKPAPSEADEKAPSIGTLLPTNQLTGRKVFLRPEQKNFVSGKPRYFGHIGSVPCVVRCLGSTKAFIAYRCGAHRVPQNELVLNGELPELGGCDGLVVAGGFLEWERHLIENGRE